MINWLSGWIAGERENAKAEEKRSLQALLKEIERQIRKDKPEYLGHFEFPPRRRVESV